MCTTLPKSNVMVGKRSSSVRQKLVGSPSEHLSGPHLLALTLDMVTIMPHTMVIVMLHIMVTIMPHTKVTIISGRGHHHTWTWSPSYLIPWSPSYIILWSPSYLDMVTSTGVRASPSEHEFSPSRRRLCCLDLVLIALQYCRKESWQVVHMEYLHTMGGVVYILAYILSNNH